VVAPVGRPLSDPFLHPELPILVVVVVVVQTNRMVRVARVS
jgi:hypothetical protein